MATIVHAADLHLDSPPLGPTQHWSGVDVRGATREAVRRLVDLALVERADLMIIAGDVFDRAADSATAGRFFAAEMDRLHQAGVPVLVAAGNHDVVCPRALAQPANVRWLPAAAPTTLVFDDLGIAVHGQSLSDPREPVDLSAAFPPPVPGCVNIGALHTSLDGGASRTICAPASLAGLATAGYDYWALGHVHQRRVVATEPWVVFPGNLQGRGPSEPGSKGATVITTVGTAVASVEHRELAVFRWEAPQPVPVG